MPPEQQDECGPGPTAGQVRAVLDRIRITSGRGFTLDPHDTGSPFGEAGKPEIKALLRAGVERLSSLQERLYASATWSLLLVFQGMDAAGKDSAIKHVMSGVNPQGVAVTSFKAPEPTALAHDFLWRVAAALPARGMIGIFNRSHYEEVLITRVHPGLLAAQHLPPGLVGGPAFWDHRIEDIAAFERHLARQGTRVLKFFLHLGRKEQSKRFLARLDEPEKNWKFSPADIKERRHWDSYKQAYEAAIAGTATPDAPWFVVPADRKSASRLLIVTAINDALTELGLAPPALTPEQVAGFAEARRALEQEG